MECLNDPRLSSSHLQLYMHRALSKERLKSQLATLECVLPGRIYNVGSHRRIFYEETELEEGKITI